MALRFQQPEIYNQYGKMSTIGKVIYAYLSTLEKNGQRLQKYLFSISSLNKKYQ